MNNVNGSEMDDLDTVCEMISPKIAILKSGETLGAKGLFSEDDWEAFGSGCIDIGKMVAELVDSKRVELMCMGTTTSNHKMYQKI